MISHGRQRRPADPHLLHGSHADAIPARPRASRGLTLLEVLAAFLIFAMVFTVLVGSSQTAVYSQGLALRRLEANMIADEVLADLESQMQQKITPVLAEDISRDPYEVSVREASFGASADAGSGTGAGAGGPEGAAVDAASLIALELPEVAKHVRRYDIEVQWMEAEGPEKITRTTFGFDWQTAAIELADLFQAAGGDLASDASGATSGDGDDDVTGRESGGATGRDSDGRARDRGSRADASRGSGELTKEQMKQIIESMQ